ncbi:MAG TPA: hypothetical protein DDY27_00895 [Hyphomonadaceae bacterium]|nr:hypothetical protein [Hyphomonadaceae bacterium]
MSGIEDMSPEAMAQIMELGIAKGVFKEGATLGMSKATDLIDEIIDKLEDSEDGSQVAAMHAVIVAVVAFLMNTAPNIKSAQVVSLSAIKCAENLINNMREDDGDSSNDDKESNNPFEW